MRESTLLEVQQDDECRCVTFRARNDQIEVGEKTSGSLTYDVYGTRGTLCSTSGRLPKGRGE